MILSDAAIYFGMSLDLGGAAGAGTSGWVAAGAGVVGALPAGALGTGMSLGALSAGAGTDAGTVPMTPPVPTAGRLAAVPL